MSNHAHQRRQVFHHSVCHHTWLDNQKRSLVALVQSLRSASFPCATGKDPQHWNCSRPCLRSQRRAPTYLLSCPAALSGLTPSSEDSRDWKGQIEVMMTLRWLDRSRHTSKLCSYKNWLFKNLLFQISTPELLARHVYRTIFAVSEKDWARAGSNRNRRIFALVNHYLNNFSNLEVPT